MSKAHMTMVATVIVGLIVWDKFVKDSALVTGG